jgi:uncharacterized integral membrane protein
MKRLTLVGISVICVIVAIILFQNWTTVNLSFLVFELSAPLGALIPVVFVSGIIVGFLVAKLMGLLSERRRARGVILEAKPILPLLDDPSSSSESEQEQERDG